MVKKVELVVNYNAVVGRIGEYRYEVTKRKASHVIDSFEMCDDFTINDQWFDTKFVESIEVDGEKYVNEFY